MLITVFTATYNRAYILPHLHKSLSEQSDKSFEWIIVNDGSIDNTEELITGWKNENKMNIRYIKTTNGGKQRAINRGVKEAKGELFFIVDSDDYLSSDAIAVIQTDWKKDTETKVEISGLCYKKIIYTTGKSIGDDFPEPVVITSLLNIIYHYKILGDMAQIFKTELLRQYPFPEIDGENFVPEAYIWNRITNDKPMKFINKGIYFCEYLEDGLSNNFSKNLKRNPKGFSLYYRNVLSYKVVSLKDKLKAIVRIIQCYIYNLIK